MIVATLFGLFAFAAPAESSALQDDYVAKLTSAEPTAQAQLRLGTWARNRGLKEEAAGHLRAAAHLDPQLAAAQKALGRTLQDGRWETKEERRRRLDREVRLQADRAMWRRLFEEIGMETALRRRPLTEAAAAAAEEFAAQSEAQSHIAVKALADNDHGAATVALLRQAVASQFPRVRAAAAAALAERNPDHYLYALLDYVRPQRSGKSVVLGSGEVWYWQEGTTMYVAAPDPSAPIGLQRPSGERNDVELSMEARQADAARVRANAVTALQTITGQKIGDDFAAWRQVVMQIGNSFVDSRHAPPSEVAATYYQPETTVVGIRQQPVMMHAIVPIPRRGSCFAAGTLVATKRGLVPIDKVCIGELALSKDLETGQTTYKPVLARTLRPRTPMKKLSVGGETLSATLGHPFWTESKGWVKVKDLAAGMTLGAEDSKVALSKIEEAAEPQQAYNLVVADFGTYFVGKSRVLVHDNTPIRDVPTTARDGRSGEAASE